MNPSRIADWFVGLLVLVGGCLGPPCPARADLSFEITAQTTALAGSAGYIDFQFNPQGSMSLSALASVSGFQTDGTLGALLPPLGDVSGMLPATVALDNGTPTNEYTQAFTYDTTISFDVTLSGPALGNPAPTGSSILLTLYDSTGNPLSTGPGGALATIDITSDGTTTGTAYSPSSPGGPTATVVTPSVVPEPSTLFPMGLGLAAFLGWGLFQRLGAG